MVNFLQRRVVRCSGFSSLRTLTFPIKQTYQLEKQTKKNNFVESPCKF